MIHAGKLRHVVEIQEATRARTASGGFEFTWSKVTERRASIAPLRGREYFEAAQSQGELTHKVTMRPYDGLTGQHRLKFGTRILETVSVIDAEERGRMMVVMCREAVSA